jgi:hypothetical protein
VSCTDGVSAQGVQNNICTYVIGKKTPRKKLHNENVRFEVFMAVTMKNGLLGYKNPVRTSQGTYYFSATESSR